jgi:hypothetical protein
MAMMIYPMMRLSPKGISTPEAIDSDLSTTSDYTARYLKGSPPDRGDIPRIVKTTWHNRFPDAIGHGLFWIFSRKLLDFIAEANGSQWPLRACEINFAIKSGQELPFMFLYGPPRFHRYNHDVQTYPLAKKELRGREDSVRWVKNLSGDLTPAGRSMRPFRHGEPHFWEDEGVIEGDTLWSGGSWGAGEKYVSDSFWNVLNKEFPQIFGARHITEKQL